MTERLPDLLLLTRCDPDLNMARFYAISIEPTLFGEVSLVRTWGRIGTHGQVRMETLDDVREACAAAETLGRTKRRRGYSDATPRG